MKDLTKKVVILKNLASPYVHQAIIVMRDYDPKLETRAVLEAERIVDAYLDNMKLKSGRGHSRTVRKGKTLLTAVITAAVTAACILLILR